MEKIREFNRSLTMPLGGYATEAEIRADARRSCQKPAEKSVRELAESSRVIQVEIRDRVNGLKSAAGTPAPVRSLEPDNGTSRNDPVPLSIIKPRNGGINLEDAGGWL